MTDDAARFAACVGAPAVVVAMAEEAEPFLADADSRCENPHVIGGAELYAVEAAGRPVLVVRTGIGLVNAASTLSVMLERFKPSAVISAGSAGGLRADVNVGDLVIGTEFRYADADATAFGYEPGQVPGMPPAFAASSELVTAASSLAAAEGYAAWRGTMLSGGAFVTARNVGATREVFPGALSTDMETTAIAQVTAGYGVPFLSVRGISDLCGPAADQDFHLAVEIVAERSARTVLALLDAA